MVAVTVAHHLLLLPGAGGAASFWHPLGALLPASWRKIYLRWPGLGHEPHAPTLQGLDDAVAHAASRLERPSVVALLPRLHPHRCLQQSARLFRLRLCPHLRKRQVTVPLRKGCSPEGADSSNSSRRRRCVVSQGCGFAVFAGM